MQVTRRSAIAGLAASSLLRVPVWAAEPSPRDTSLAIVFLKGGLDALAAVEPVRCADLQALRPGLRPHASSCPVEDLILDGHFALHPSLARLAPFYRAGELLVVPATAIPEAGLSHAAARWALLGWLDDASETSKSSLRFFTTQAEWSRSDYSSDLVSNLIGADNHLGLAGLCDLATAGLPEGMTNNRQACERMAFIQAATQAGLSFAHPQRPRVACLELSGFDTHAAQGGGSGRLARSLATLADGLVALAGACGSAWQRTAVLVVTEFGRSVRPNGKGGTDHGTASVTLLLGGAVAGGRVVGRWPGLAAEQLHRGNDLAPTTDVRSLVRAALADHVGLSECALASVYPRNVDIPGMPGLFRT